jgi:hypothetical protein
VELRIGQACGLQVGMRFPELAISRHSLKQGLSLMSLLRQRMKMLSITPIYVKVNSILHFHNSRLS